MDIVGLFKDSLIYPTKEWDKLLIFGVLFIIMSIFGILELFGLSLRNYIGASVVSIISLILTIIITLIIWGYTLSITRKSINNVDGNVPEFVWVKNIIDGLKVLVLRIVYYIIPVIITVIVAYVTGAFRYMYQLLMYYFTYGSIDSASQALLSSATTSLIIVSIVAVILFTVFTLLFLAAIAVLAETESIGAAVNMVDVFKKIGEINWGNYIIWAILYAIILLIISVVINFIAIIPLIGVIIALLIFRPYADMFAARALGLIYNESKE